MITTYKPTARSLLILLFILMGIVCAFNAINFGGLRFGDESYQALCVADYATSPIGMLTYYIGHIWCSLFGFNLFSLRLLTSIEALVAVGLPCWYLQLRVRRPLLSALTFFAMMATLRISQFNFYNWDTGSYIFDSVALVTMMSIIHRPVLWKSVLLGATVACMSLARVPLVIFIIPALVTIIGAGRRHNRPTGAIAGAITCFLLAQLVTFTLLTCLMTGSPAAYFATFTTDNIISGHSPADIHEWIWRLSTFGPFQLIWWYPAFATLFLSWLSMRCWPAHKGVIATAVAITIALTLLIIRKSTYETEHVWTAMGFAAPLLLGPVLFCYLSNITRTSYRRIATPRLQLWICGLTPLLITIGSDTFFQRIAVAFAIPCAIAAIWPLLAEDGHRYLRSFLVITAIVMGTSLAVHTVLKIWYNSLEAPACVPFLQGIRHNKTDYIVAREAALQTRRIEAQGKKYMLIGERYIGRLCSPDIAGDIGPSRHYFNVLSAGEEFDRALSEADVVISIGMGTGIPDGYAPGLDRYGYKATQIYPELVIYEKSR